MTVVASKQHHRRSRTIRIRRGRMNINMYEGHANAEGILVYKGNEQVV